ncbi:MAG: hypothetical protein QNJ75_09025 [Acidimicrobiia bacterium]|nr:hypothetical protein [Acidimicrobiia bacterium]
MNEWSDDWDDFEAADAPEAGEAGARRSRVWIFWAFAGLLVAVIWVVWMAALLNPDNYRMPVDLSSPLQVDGASDGAADTGRSAWLALWIGGHVLLQAVALVLIFRRRHRMSTRLIVKWSLLVLLLPFAGILGFYFYLLENAIQRGVPGRQDESASFLRSPRQGT